MKRLPKLHYPFSKGVTLIEMLVVISLLSVMTFPIIITYRNSRSQQALRSSSEQLADHIRTTHIFARESKDKKGWGIVSTGPSSYALAAGTLNNHTLDLVYSLEQDITFVNGFSIWFDQGSGNTENPVSVELTNAAQKKIKIDVLKSGTVEVNSK